MCVCTSMAENQCETAVAISPNQRPEKNNKKAVL